MLPDFIVFASVKGGTTSLYGALAQHPFVQPCTTNDPHFANTKEVHYFDYGYHRGADWYRTHFPLERERTEFERVHGRPFITGEATGSYISHPWAPERVRRLLPDVKLIAILRNPVDRAYSQFQMSRREGVEELSFEEALDREDERIQPALTRMKADPRYLSWDFGCWSYLARGRYAEQLEPWFELFPREQFLFVPAEEFYDAPQEVLDRAHGFLGVPDHRYDEVAHLNSGGYGDAVPPDVRARLTEYFRPHNDRLRELTGVDFGWDRESVAA